jgi:hypothetical protein
MGYITYELYSSRSDHNLGSIEFTDRIIEFSIKEFYIETQISLRKNKRALSLIRQASIKAFYELVETKSQVRIKIEKILVNPDFDLDTTLTYEHFQILCKDLFQVSRTLVSSLFERTEFSKRDVDEVILVGHASSLLIELSQANVERIDLIDKKVFGVTLEAAFKMGSYKDKQKFVLLNYTKGETNGESKSEKKNTFENKPYNEPDVRSKNKIEKTIEDKPYNKPDVRWNYYKIEKTFEDELYNEPDVRRMNKIEKTLEDEPYHKLFNFVSSSFPYTFKQIFAAIIGTGVLFAGPAFLCWGSQKRIYNPQRLEPSAVSHVTFDIGNSSNNNVVQRQAPSARNILNQTASEASSRENIRNRLIILSDIVNYPNHMSMVRED